ncbi:MAG TPA: TlpA family protein disulfide reductase [Candidatus Acetothermia bacterium]|nr:TlpA family protein disulfide reductase [Candidatus Acetothermia bacterium]
MTGAHAAWWVKLGLAAAMAAVGWMAGGGTVGTADAPCLPPATSLDLMGVEVGPYVGQRAPDFTLPDLGGTPVQLSSFRGCPVLLDFWATWCKPCLITVPEIETLRQKHARRGLKVVAVNLDYRREDGARYLAANGYTGFIALWAPFTEARAVAYLFGIQAIPHTVLIDRQGIIRFSGPPTLLTEDVIAPWL